MLRLSERTVSSPNTGVAKQIIASAIVSISALSYGLMQGWNSPMTSKLQSENSPVGPMSKNDIANLFSFPAYFALFVGISMIYVTNRFGRKPAMIVSSILCAFGFLIITFAISQPWLFFGKVLSNLAGGGIGGPQMYISETAHPSIRGILMSACTMQINVGILLAYILGKLLNFQLFNIVLSTVPAIFTILMFWLPETPYFLVGRSKYVGAKESLLWLRGGDINLAEQELEVIKNASRSDEKREITILQEMTQPATKVAFIVSAVGYILQTLSGIHSVINYAGVIFDEAGSPLSADDSSILTGILNLIASIINLFLIDIFGRKPLLFISFIGGSVSLTVLSVFLYIRQHGGHDSSQFGWIPITSLSAFIFTYGLGLASVPGVLMDEMAPTKVKPIMGSVVGVVCLVAMLSTIQLFPFVDDNLGLYMCIAIPAISNTLGILFTAFAVPETKGKSLVQIAEELNSEDLKI